MGPVNVTSVEVALDYFSPDDKVVLQIRPDDPATGFARENATVGNTSFVTPPALGAYMPNNSVLVYVFTASADVTLYPGSTYWVTIWTSAVALQLMAGT